MRQTAANGVKGDVVETNFGLKTRARLCLVGAEPSVRELLSDNGFGVSVIDAMEKEDANA